MSYERIKLEYEGNIAVLKFNHPEVMNAVGARMLTELQTAVRELRDRGPAVRCLLITGEGRGFCAGANLADEERTQQRETQGAGDGLRTGYHPLLLGMRDLEVPIVTAVNGAAAGVGMSFALMGDIVCAGRSALASSPMAGPPISCRVLSAGPGRRSSPSLPIASRRSRRWSGVSSIACSTTKRWCPKP